MKCTVLANASGTRLHPIMRCEVEITDLNKAYLQRSDRTPTRVVAALPSSTRAPTNQ